MVLPQLHTSSIAGEIHALLPITDAARFYDYMYHFTLRCRHGWNHRF